MTRRSTVENLLDRIHALPDEAQVEIVRALIEGQAGEYELDRVDDDQGAERPFEKV